MKAAVLGSGGREHALALRISTSPLLTKLYTIPGNPGTESFSENVNLDINSSDQIINFCSENGIDLVVIGPEVPLVKGLADVLREKGFKVFGPGALAARIEGDKVFSKELMKKYSIPTAAFASFSKSDHRAAEEYVNKSNYPLVLKASGLAAGKGVIICQNAGEASEVLRSLFQDSIFGEAGDQVVIEEFMTGEEASLFAVTDGKDFVCLPAAQDHKRIGDNDTGKNTGGMGAYAPAPIMDAGTLKKVEIEIIEPTLRALREEGCEFNGCLYCGLMITEEGPKVVEFNCRFGDPETQVVLPLLKGDFLKLLYSAAEGKIDHEAVYYSGGSAVCVVAASKGYPDKFDKGFEITGLDAAENIIIYHAGTKKAGDKIITNGGRVLNIAAVSEVNDLSSCKRMVYDAIKNVCFDNIYYRTDIADRGIKKQSSI